jgi:hypothetical protein
VIHLKVLISVVLHRRLGFSFTGITDLTQVLYLILLLILLLKLILMYPYSMRNTI